LTVSKFGCLWIGRGEVHGAQYTKVLWPVLREPPEPM
jgi:hypothetical protein